MLHLNLPQKKIYYFQFAIFCSKRGLLEMYAFKLKNLPNTFFSLFY